MSVLATELAALRTRLEVPEGWPEDVLAEAEQAARAPRLPAYDATALPLFTIDPPDSRDLDQAMHLERRGTGYRVHYAIADVGAFVRPGGAVDTEARRRVETLYFPDGRVPLHPPQLSEDAASLLPGQDVPALLWQLDLDADGALERTGLRRALVRSRRKLDYSGVQHAIDASTADPALALLGVIGPLREQQERDRGGISLPLPDQEVEEVRGGYALAYRAPRPADGWNAQISLLTGMAAAALMLDAGIGLLRTMPAAPPAAYARSPRPSTSPGRPTCPTPNCSAPSTRASRPTPPSSTSAPPCCAAPATPPSTAPSRPTPGTPPSRPRTPTAPPRCAASPTASPARPASHWRRAARSRSGSAPRCRCCPS